MDHQHATSWSCSGLKLGHEKGLLKCKMKAYNNLVDKQLIKLIDTLNGCAK